MKLIHCADLHLDSRMESNLSSEKARERRDELFETFRSMVNYAKENDVRIVIIAGDMFDTKNSQLRMKRRVHDLITAEKDIDFLYLKGNHDSAAFFSEEEQPENLKTFDNSWTYYTYDNIVIAGSESCGDYDNLELSEDNLNIVVLHGQEASGNASGDDIINIARLAGRHIDYLALGHIHSYKCEKIDKRGIYCYSGCLEGRGFDECGEKGFILLDTDGENIKHEFIPIAKRTLHTVNVSLDGALTNTDISSRIDESISGIPQKDLVKIVLTGEIDEDTDIDVLYIERMYENRFYFLKVYDRTSLRIDYESYINDISLKGEFIRLVSAADMDDTRKKEIILTGLKALAGREIDI